MTTSKRWFHHDASQPSSPNASEPLALCVGGSLLFLRAGVEDQ